MARFRVASKHQVSGWRFLLNRIEHVLVRRDASMLDDPGRGRNIVLLLRVAPTGVCMAGSAVVEGFVQTTNWWQEPGAIADGEVFA